MLVLQVAVQSETAPRQVLTNDRHAEVGPVTSAELRRERVPKVTGRIGTPTGLSE
ncbi:Uncharacterised protein [Mycobacteroides abscessus subsp. massiliense]|nr:Uncharacterised protein [Mycobacteroides abscessus subsp. massiliense]